MSRILALGVPDQIRTRLEKAAGSHQQRISTISCGVDGQGFFRLRPHPAAAVHHLRVFYDDEAFATSYSDALVVVFPYAEVPSEVLDELDTIEALGGQVVYVEAGKNDWPEIPKRQRSERGDRFFNAVFDAAVTEIFGPQAITASELFLSITTPCPRIIIVNGALRTCDEIARHRISFLRDVALAFVEFVDNNGAAGRVDAFFKEKGIDHAQTGGIETTLKVYLGERCVYNHCSHTHLKKGDNTTPQAAVRIYYHSFNLGEELYLAVVYVGPHPKNNINCEHALEECEVS